jgi:L-ascorbate metabolism protein UlaG (beta-lactamase superfamily)
MTGDETGAESAVTLTFVGNATTLIGYGPFTLLTDPNFLRRGQRAYLGYGLRSRRLKDPAIAVQELPELDGVILSHLHGDHWDGVAERHLDRRLPILTTGAASRALRRRGFRQAEGLPTWESETLTKGGHQIRVTALPGRHAPGPFRRLLPPVMGSLLEFGPRGGEPELRVHISGDTLMYDDLAQIRHRYPDIDTGIVHLGGTRLLGVLPASMNGRQGARWLETTGCRTVVPVHYDDYTVFKSPLSHFERELARRDLQDRLLQQRLRAPQVLAQRVLPIGAGRLVGRAEDSVRHLAPQPVPEPASRDERPPAGSADPSRWPRRRGEGAGHGRGEGRLHGGGVDGAGDALHAGGGEPVRAVDSAG